MKLSQGTVAIYGDETQWLENCFLDLMKNGILKWQR